MCPFEYTWGCTGILSPTNVTSGESNGYLLLNLNNSWKCSPSYSVPSTPSILIFHLYKIPKLISSNDSIDYWVRWTYWAKFWPMLSASTTTPGGGSFIKDINSFCSRRCGWEIKRVDIHNSQRKWMHRWNFEYEMSGKRYKILKWLVIVTCLPTWVI